MLSWLRPISRHHRQYGGGHRGNHGVLLITYTKGFASCAVDRRMADQLAAVHLPERVDRSLSLKRSLLLVSTCSSAPGAILYLCVGRKWQHYLIVRCGASIYLCRGFPGRGVTRRGCSLSAKLLLFADTM